MAIASESRFAGCLLGLAIGDALGLVSENLSRRAIRKRFGEVDHFSLWPGRAIVSDDTEQAIALAASLAACGRWDAADYARRLRNWFWTLPPFIGLATLRACLKLTVGMKHSGVGSAGNGSAMRVAPLGLFFAGRPDELAGAATECSRLTHTHPRATAGAVVVAEAVAALATSETLPESGPFLSRLAQTAARCDVPMADALARLPTLLALSADEALDQIGTSGYVLHTVPAALYCFFRTPGSFRDTVITAASGGGDTDTIGAIAGAISGAANGVDKIPKEWVDGLQSTPGAGRAAYLRGVAGALRQAAASGQAQPLPQLGLARIASARAQMLALLAAHIVLRAAWLMIPERRRRASN